MISVPTIQTNDIDGDGICGEIDNCPDVSNPDQQDSNENGIGDACQSLDSDGDGINDYDEISLGTDPFNPDTDNDELLDGEEVKIHGTDPLNWDADRDRLDDGIEVHMFGTDPYDWDTDGDGISDEEELSLQTHFLSDCPDPFEWDTDGDGISD